MEKEQVSVLYELPNFEITVITIISNFENTHNRNVIFAGDFNIFFGALLDAWGGNPTLKIDLLNW